MRQSLDTTCDSATCTGASLPRVQTSLGAIETVLFDKDGTLFDFHQTWDHAVVAALRQVAAQDSEALEGAAAALGVDLAAGTVRPDAPFVFETNQQIADRLRPHLSPTEFGGALSRLTEAGCIPAVGIRELLSKLQGENVSVGLVTNDSEGNARLQLEAAGWTSHFACVVGCDSGFGGKPDAGPVLGALSQLAGKPEAAVMIGDAWPDVVAGKAAGVLTAYLGDDEELIEIADLAAPDLVNLAKVLFEL